MLWNIKNACNSLYYYVILNLFFIFNNAREPFQIDLCASCNFGCKCPGMMSYQWECVSFVMWSFRTHSYWLASYLTFLLPDTFWSTPLEEHSVDLLRFARFLKKHWKYIYFCLPFQQWKLTVSNWFTVRFKSMNPSYNIHMYWRNFCQPTNCVKQNIFEKLSNDICSPNIYASFGTFWIKKMADNQSLSELLKIGEIWIFCPFRFKSDTKHRFPRAKTI